MAIDKCKIPGEADTFLTVGRPKSVRMRGYREGRIAGGEVAYRYAFPHTIKKNFILAPTNF